MISIIITAYNVESTISKAIQSCLNQTYSDLEILVINDRSTDNTLQILESFKGIRIINNKENVGAGMSRRIGTKEAKGEYTTFLDGDDYLKEDFIETLYNAAIKYDADVVSSGIYSEETASDITYPKDEVVTPEHKFDTINLISRYLNNKLIRRTIWNKVDYSSRRYVEDTQTSYYILFYADKTVNLKYVGYIYTYNPNSLCHTADKLKTLIYTALCAKDICVFNSDHNKDRVEQSLQAFIVRLHELGQEDIPDSIQEEYKDELSELFTFFLQNIAF